MKTNTIRWFVVEAVVLAVFHVVVFAIPFERTTVFWISYGFTLAAILMQIYVIRTAFYKGEGTRSKFYGFPIAKIGVVYLIVQLVFCLVFMAVATHVKNWIPLVLYTVLLGVAAVGFIAADATRDEIEHQDVKLKKNVSVMRDLQSQATALVTLAKDADAVQELTQFADEMRYSDPVSSEALNAIEADLASCIDEIQKAIVEDDYVAVIQLSKKARSVLSERNRLCKLNKA